MSYAFDVVDELINDITESLNKLKEINTTQEKILCSIIKAYSPENECQNIFDEYTEKEYFLKITNVFLEGNLYITRINLLINTQLDTLKREQFLSDPIYKQAVSCFQQNNIYPILPTSLYVQELYKNRMNELHQVNLCDLSRRGFNIAAQEEKIMQQCINIFSKYKDIEWGYEILLAVCKSVKIKICSTNTQEYE